MSLPHLRGRARLFTACQGRQRVHTQHHRLGRTCLGTRIQAHRSRSPVLASHQRRVLALTHTHQQRGQRLVHRPLFQQEVPLAILRHRHRHRQHHPLLRRGSRFSPPCSHSLSHTTLPLPPEAVGLLHPIVRLRSWTASPLMATSRCQMLSRRCASSARCVNAQLSAGNLC